MEKSCKIDPPQRNLISRLLFLRKLLNPKIDCTLLFTGILLDILGIIIFLSVEIYKHVKLERFDESRRFSNKFSD